MRCMWVGRGAGTLLVDPGIVLAWSGAVRGPGVRALRGGGTRCVVLGAAVFGPGTAGAECHRGRPRGAGFALPSWRRVWTWVWAWLRVAVVAR